MGEGIINRVFLSQANEACANRVVAKLEVMCRLLEMLGYLVHDHQEAQVAAEVCNELRSLPGGVCPSQSSLCACSEVSMRLWQTQVADVHLNICFNTYGKKGKKLT